MTAMQFKKTQGQRVGAVPYGFDLADNGVHLRSNPDEQAVITHAKALRTHGLSLRKIAAELQRQGFRARKGGIFQSEQIRRMVA